MDKNTLVTLIIGIVAIILSIVTIFWNIFDYKNNKKKFDESYKNKIKQDFIYKLNHFTELVTEISLIEPLKIKSDITIKALRYFEMNLLQHSYIKKIEYIIQKIGPYNATRILVKSEIPFLSKESNKNMDTILSHIFFALDNFTFNSKEYQKSKNNDILKEITKDWKEIALFSGKVSFVLADGKYIQRFKDQ